MTKVICISAILLLLGGVLAGCPSATPVIPTITNFSINNGDASTSDTAITLNNTCTGIPTQYMASESSSFTGASWQTYTTAPSLSLSSDTGAKMVYFKVKNAVGESTVFSDTIMLNEDTATEETVLLPGNIPLTMVWCPAGTFLMGAPADEQDSYDWEKPQHQVTLTQGFWMGKYELTKAQWTALMGTAPWTGYSLVLNDPDSPAVFVSWTDAQAFIAALNTLTGKTFRLPSEAEWEYACRVGTTTRFFFGDDPNYNLLGSYAWYKGNCSSQQYAHIVGQKLPNGFGLYDVSGNVVEWCEDDWHDNYTGAPTNGSAWVDSPRSLYRVHQGGSWYDVGRRCRSANRNGNNSTTTSSDVGFRLAR